MTRKELQICRRLGRKKKLKEEEKDNEAVTRREECMQVWDAARHLRTRRDDAEIDAELMR